MASEQSIFPIRGPVDADTTARVLPLDEAGRVVEALSSETARSILERLNQTPSTASDLSESLGISLQNASYHLNQLLEVGIIEVVDTWYSERGCTMDVYAPADKPLVIVAGSPNDEADIKETVSTLTDTQTDHEPAVVTDGGPEASLHDVSDS